MTFFAGTDHGTVGTAISTTDENGNTVRAVVPAVQLLDSGGTSVTPATAAKQDTGNTSLASIDTKLTTQAGYLDGIEGLLAAATPAGSAIIGKVGIDQTTPGTTNAVQIVPAYKIAKSSLHRNSGASTNAELLGSGTKMVFGVDVANKHATNWAYVKLYNKASTPTVGTDVPTKVIPVAPNSARFIPDTIGKAFPLGIGLAITGGAADSDTAAVGAGDVQVDIEYL